MADQHVRITPNNSASGGSGISQLSGEATTPGGGSGAVTLDNASVIAKILTGFASGAGTVSSSDSILTAIQKIVGNLAAKIASGDAAGGDLTGTYPNPTIANGAVTLAKQANAAQATIRGRASGAGTGAPQDLTGTQATAILDAFVGDSGSGGTKGLVPAPASGDALATKFLKADGTWSPATFVPIFGNGADGAFSASSGTTTPTRAQYWSSITLTSTAIIANGSYPIYCSGIANVGSGTVIGKKANIGGASGTGGSIAVAALLNGGGSAGGNGGTTTGVAGANVTSSLGVGGGAGGSGSSGAGGGGGTATAPSAAQGGLEWLNSIFGFQNLFVYGTTTKFTASAGGGGGGGDGTSGAGGGAGGSILQLFCKVLQGSGTIRQSGGDGGSPAAGNRGAGGGGGGGVILVVSTNDTTTTSLTFDVAGGTAGTSTGTGGAASNGSTGVTYRLVV